MQTLATRLVTLAKQWLFFTAHSTLHFTAYLLPRILLGVCVKFPRWALSTVFGRRHDSHLPRVVIVADPTRRDTLQLFGIDLAPQSPSSGELRAARIPSIPNSSSSTLTSDATYTAPLYDGHLSTILGAYRRFPFLEMHREVVSSSFDGNPIYLDFMYPPGYLPAAASANGALNGTAHHNNAEAHRSTQRPPRALVLILPGLTGTSTEVYIRRISASLLQNNLAVCVLNARGVRTTQLTVPQTFSALFTADLRHVLHAEAITHRFGAAIPIIAVAFSLGGLILTNYLGEEGRAGRRSSLAAAFTITSPHSLLDGDTAMRRPVARMLYGRALSNNLRDYYKRNEAMMHRLPGVDHALLFDGKHPLIDTICTVRGFDDVVTGPHFGFPDAVAYYMAADNFPQFKDVHTPQMCLVAANDPICGPPKPEDVWLTVARQHPGGLVYVQFPSGGHLGFLGSPLQELRGELNPMEQVLLRAVLSVVRAKATASTDALHSVGDPTPVAVHS